MVFINGEFIKIDVERAEARLHEKHDPCQLQKHLLLYRTAYQTFIIPTLTVIRLGFPTSKN